MAKIIWSPKAINELGRICDYIGENSEYYARLFAESVFKRIEQLVLFPYSRRIVPKDNPKQRLTACIWFGSGLNLKLHL